MSGIASFCYDPTRRLRSIWNGMIARCERTDHRSFPSYGARGIKVYPEWKENLHSFIDWALSHGYAGNLTIDRIDNDGNYEPENCQWITANQNFSKPKHRKYGLGERAS
jgi:hypothetical protein